MVYLIRRIFLIFLILLIGNSRAQAEEEVPSQFRDEAEIDITWCLLNPHLPYADEVLAEIRKATDYWTSCTSFLFKEVSADFPANIKFHFQDGVFRKKMREVAYSLYSGFQPKGVVYVNRGEKWSYLNRTNKQALNLHTILEHQLGYVLHLENSSHFSATKTPYYNFVKLLNSTEYDNKNLVSERYGEPLNICKSKFDAVSLYHGDFIVFVKKYVYFKANGTYAYIRDYWPELPTDLTKIDKFYADGKNFELFFIGKQIYAFQDYKLKADYPKDLYSSLPEFRSNYIDAVLPYKDEVHVISDQQYWQFNQSSDIFMGPYNTSKFNSLPPNIETAFKNRYGLTFVVYGEIVFPIDSNTSRLLLESVQNKTDIVCLSGKREFQPPACCKI